MSLALKGNKIALVTDWMVAPGGSDRFARLIADSLQNQGYEVTIFTSYYQSKNYEKFGKPSSPVVQSFIARLPLAQYLHRHYNIFTPLAFESFEFSGFDAVVSLSAGPAKSVITAPGQPHLSVILTPPRFLWDHSLNVRGSLLRKLYRPLASLVSHYLRIWDQSAVLRADKHLTISTFIQQLFTKIYRMDSEILHPPIEDFWFEVGGVESKQNANTPYFLTVSRLYDYKKIDLLIRATISSDAHLKIVGEGPDRKYLESVAAGSDNIEFLGSVGDDELKALYSGAEAFLFGGIEDFGLVMVEAQAVGTPVIAYNDGGARDIVVEGETGELFNSEAELVAVLKRFDRSVYENKKIIENAKRFSYERFHEKFSKILAELIKQKSCIG